MHPLDFLNQSRYKKIIFNEKGSTANKHFQISLIKSVIRIASCVVLCYGNYVVAGVGLAIAEVLGIYEEIA